MISEFVWTSVPKLHSAPLINETYIQMLFSSGSSFSTRPSHSILLLLCMWAFQSKRKKTKTILDEIILNWSIKHTDTSASLTWSVWLIWHTPFQFNFISGGSKAVKPLRKGRVQWLRTSCCRPWCRLLALSIKTTKWASRERERRDFGAFFFCLLSSAEKLFKRNGAAAVQVRAERESSAEGWTPSGR